MTLPFAGAGSAMEAYDSVPEQHGGNPPRGAVVFYNYTGWAWSGGDGRWVYGNWGHATISLGDGNAIMSPQSPWGPSVVMPLVNGSYGSPIGWYYPGP